MAYTLTANDYIDILRDELKLALGCTEPIAIAYCAAEAKRVLGKAAERCEIEVSGNIIKNAKSVIVPGTDGMKGIAAAAAAGIVAGDPAKKLEVITGLTATDRAEIKKFLKSVPMKVIPSETKEKLYIKISLFADEESSEVCIAHTHTNIIWEKKNSEVLIDNTDVFNEDQDKLENDPIIAKKALLTVKGIIDFADNVDIELIRDIIQRQITCNTAIAREGIVNNWGANIGSTILASSDMNIRNRAKAYAAAGSDARMSGCELPVVINSGSGNQGITVTLPVVIYAESLNASEEKLYRALLISNLISIHIKYGIGALSAFCGAVSAGCAAGCGIAYLHGCDYDAISQVLSNSLATASGIICDGAKPSCAAKIALAVDAGIMGFEMYRYGQRFNGGDGIVGKNVECTIDNIADIGSEGMRSTDWEILKIMTG